MKLPIASAVTLISCSALMASPALAQPGSGYSDGPHAYIGANYGLFRARGGEFDDEDDLLELNAGYFFNPHFGLEASATWFGEYGGSIASADVYGYGLAAVGRLPVTDTWSLYAKGGQFFWRADVTTEVGDTDFDGDDLFYALGTDIRLSEGLSLVIEYTRYEIDTRASDFPGVDNTDLDTLKAGIRLRF